MRKERIFIVKLDEIGDVILATPAIKALRRAHPDGILTWVVTPMVYPLVKNCPHVDQVLSFSRNKDVGALHKILTLWKAFRFCWNNKLFRCSQALLLRSRPYSTEYLLVRASVAVRRTGWLNPDLFWSKYCINDVLTEKPGKHEVDRLISAVSSIDDSESNPVELWIENEDRNSVAHYNLENRSIILLGCTHPKILRRAWPVEKYAELVLNLHKKFPRYNFIAIGGPGDKEITSELSRLSGGLVTSIAGQLSLGETCALMEQSLCYIGNDSGPMHMAAATGLPVIEISCHVKGGDPDHANAPERFGPVGVKNRVCRPITTLKPCVSQCSSMDAHCIKLITVQSVADAFIDLRDELN
jgi:heptosyltransferase-2